MNSVLRRAHRNLKIRLTSLGISNESNVMIIAKYTRSYLSHATSELFMLVCNFCELFLLLFILSYVIFQSYWILILILAGVVGILYNFQDMFVYHPQEPPESKYYVEQPSLFNIPFDVVDLTTSDSVRLHSYLLKQSSDSFKTAPTIVMFHGNAGNIGQRLPLAQYFYNFCECNVFMVEYRGYGLSQGVQCEKGFYKDAECAIIHLLSRDDIDTTKIILHGQSIGGAVVIDLTSRFNERLFAMIVENTFTSLPDIGRELFGGIPGVRFLPDFCFKNQYQSIEKVKFITIPCLFISGLSDTMIPPRQLKTLFDKCNSTYKRCLEIEEGNHNNTWLCAGYFQFIKKFIQETINFKKNLSNPANERNGTPNSLVWRVNAR